MVKITTLRNPTISSTAYSTAHLSQASMSLSFLLAFNLPHSTAMITILLSQLFLCSLGEEHHFLGPSIASDSRAY